MGEEGVVRGSLPTELTLPCLVSPESLSPSSLSIVMPADLPAEGSVEPSLAEGDEKKKQQRRGRKKSKLEDMFPAYLQVGFRLPRVKGGSAPTGHQEIISLNSSCRKPSLGRNFWT